jgi:hypothetical protein
LGRIRVGARTINRVEREKEAGGERCDEDVSFAWGMGVLLGHCRWERSKRISSTSEERLLLRVNKISDMVKPN